MLIKLHFFQGEGDILDKAVRLWQSMPTRDAGSRYSHVELETAGITYSADAQLGRVVRVPFKWHNPADWDTVTMTMCNAEAVMEFLETQVGKGYDYLGIFTAQILALPVDDPKRWFCSELCARACKVGGHKLEHYDSWYNPRRLYNVLKDD